MAVIGISAIVYLILSSFPVPIGLYLQLYLFVWHFIQLYKLNRLKTFEGLFSLLIISLHIVMFIFMLTIVFGLVGYRTCNLILQLAIIITYGAKYLIYTFLRVQLKILFGNTSLLSYSSKFMHTWQLALTIVFIIEAVLGVIFTSTYNSSLIWCKASFPPWFFLLTIFFDIGAVSFNLYLFKDRLIKANYLVLSSNDIETKFLNQKLQHSLQRHAKLSTILVLCTLFTMFMILLIGVVFFWVSIYFSISGLCITFMFSFNHNKSQYFINLCSCFYNNPLLKKFMSLELNIHDYDNQDNTSLNSPGSQETVQSASQFQSS